MRFLFTLFLSAVLSCAAQDEKPNVIFILADDLGYSDLGCYGGEIATPHLDSLAKNGLRFTQFYNTGRCWPSRAALLTGYYAQQINRDRLPDSMDPTNGNRPSWARLLPDFLRPAGYRSYHSGKWHIDGKVLAGGFDRSLNFDKQGNHFSGSGNIIDDKPAPSNDPAYYSTTAIADHAIDCLKDHASHHADKPFFHYITFTAPHFPLHAPPEDIEIYRDRYLTGWDTLRKERFQRQRDMGLVRTTLSPLEPDLGPPYAFPNAIRALGPGEVNRPLPWAGLSEEQKRFQATKMAIHAAMIDRLDQEIGHILTQLKAMNALDNTLLCFASDNGASAEIMIRGDGHKGSKAPGSADTYLCLGPGFSSAANTPFRRHKVWMHEGGISTPFIVHWPKVIRDKGALRHTPGHLIDFVPTVLELAGIQKPGKWNGEDIPQAPGISLVPAFHNDSDLPPRRLWWLHEGNRAMRIGDWKLVAPKGEPWQLHDLTKDRAEQHDLRGENPAKARELENVWKDLTRQFGERVSADHPVIVPGAKLEKLADGFLFTEGATCDPQGNVFFVDQPNNRIHKWSTDDKLSTFMDPAHRANGMCFDKVGRLFVCADEKNELWEVAKDGKITILAQKHEGQLLNGPNDVFIHPSGALYFTDPFYKRPWWTHTEMPQSSQQVYRLSPDRKQLTRVTDHFKTPNGIIGTPDGKRLYVADRSANRTYAYDIQPDGDLSNQTLFCEEGSDGMTLDDAGNLYLTGHGVLVFDKTGNQIAHIEVPEKWSANVCFGGIDRQSLFITASKGLYRVRTKFKGANPGK